MLTVLMATHNGERTLPAVLEAYRHLGIPEGGWRLVVVDNASSDRTPRILEQFEALLPMTRLHQAAPGKNRALNAGLAAVSGDLVVLTDDDAVPHPDWLKAMRSAADTHTEFDIFGGAIVARWEHEPEGWLLHWVPMGVTYTITDECLPEGPIEAGQIWGPNMAVRAHLFAGGQRFDESIGPKQGASYAMGSEIELTLRLEALGHRAWFVRGATVGHMIRSFQMERSWVLRRAIRYGRGLFRSDRQKGVPMASTVFGVPRWLLRRIATDVAALASSKLKGDQRSSFLGLWTLYRDCGYLAEAKAFSRKQ